jgi:hypothetical protein
MKRTISFVAAVSLAACVFAQQTTAPATGTLAAEHLKAKVTGIEGIVQVRSAEDQPWQKVTMGMEVGENAEFRTGPRSAVRFVIPPDQTITLDRLGTVKVLTAINQGGKLKTDLGMKYGRTRYDIEAGGREHESTIASPSSTLAVRGTKVSVFDQRPFPAQAVSLTGRAEFRDFKKRVRFGNRGQGKTVVNTQTDSAPSLAFSASVVDPNSSLARSQNDQALVASLLSSGATIGFDYDRGIRVVKGGSVPQNDNELIPTLPGTFNFVLRWQGPTDLNLGVTEPGNSPGNSTIYPLGGFDLLPSGGQIPFDHRGGANGGMEIAFYPGDIPLGRYIIAAQHMSGPDAPATVDVFRDGVRVPIATGQGDVTTASFVGAPVNPEIAAPAVFVGTVQVSPPPAKKSTKTVTATPTVTKTTAHKR